MTLSSSGKLLDSSLEAADTIAGVHSRIAVNSLNFVHELLDRSQRLQFYTMADKLVNGLRLFVTVGSTSFDSLIETVLSEPFLRGLYRNGFRSVAIQYGRGVFQEKDIVDTRDMPAIRAFTYSPSLASEMRCADVILSHGGSGSIFEALDMCKRVVIVPNRSLMHDHQMELAGELHSRNIVQVANAQDLDDVLAKVIQASKNPLPQCPPIPRNRSALASIIAQELE